MPSEHSLKHLEPVSARMTVGDMVYLKLRDALAVGRFDPGEVLTIGAMAEVFQTSHMPVREALRRLTAEGALTLGASGSVRVPAIDRARLDDISAVRILLERRATEMAVATMNEAHLTRIEQLARAHAAAAGGHDLHNLLLRNRDFHFAIYRASGSDTLPPLIESLWLQYGPYMGLLSKSLNKADPGASQAPYTETHLAIVRAIRDGDASAAANGIEADIRSTQKELRTALAAL
ncbi:MAG: GntR family transcriptional regulator [Pseudorhodobacter sp.]